MPNYLLAYHGGGEPESEAAQAAAMLAWNDWLETTGEADPATAYFEQYLDLAKGQAESLSIPGADHMLGVFSEQPEIGKQVIDKTTEWLNTAL